MKLGGIASAASVLPKMSFANSSTSGGRLKVALVGCGGRGIEAMQNALMRDGNIQIVALGDLFKDKVANADKILREFVESNGQSYRWKHDAKSFAKDTYAVTPETMFDGFDNCEKVCQTNCDVVMLVAPPYFRPAHLEICINAGKHIFAEKPMFVDVTQGRRVLELVKIADEKNLKIVTGFQRRYAEPIEECVKRIQDGQIGEITAAYCYWHNGGYVGGQSWANEYKPDDMYYQLRNWQSWIWASGDHVVEQHCHCIDVLRWAFGDENDPLEVSGFGGRSPLLPYPALGDRYSHFTNHFEYKNNAHLFSFCSQEPKTTTYLTQRVMGTKGTCFIDGGYRIEGEKPWNFSGRSTEPYETEHELLLNAVRNNTKLNTMEASAKSTMMAVAARMSAFSAKKLKYEWILKRSAENLAPETMSLDAKNPVQPLPQPGVYQLS